MALKIPLASVFAFIFLCVLCALCGWLRSAQNSYLCKSVFIRVISGKVCFLDRTLFFFADCSAPRKPDSVAGKSLPPRRGGVPDACPDGISPSTRDKPPG